VSADGGSDPAGEITKGKGGVREGKGSRIGRRGTPLK